MDSTGSDLADGSALGETAWLWLGKLGNLPMFGYCIYRMARLSKPRMEIVVPRYILYLLYVICVRRRRKRRGRKKKEEIKSLIRKCYSWLEATGQ
jgi:hypothetical protein